MAHLMCYQKFCHNLWQNYQVLYSKQHFLYKVAFFGTVALLRVQFLGRPFHRLHADSGTCL